MYVVRSEDEAIGFYSNVLDALAAASVKAKDEGFMVKCNIPISNEISKTFYTCPKCDYPTKVTGSLNTGDFEEYSKDVYAYCPYCQVNFVVVWMNNRHLPE